MEKVLNIGKLIFPSSDDKRSPIERAQAIVVVIKETLPLMADFCAKHESWLRFVETVTNQYDADEFLDFIMCYCNAHGININVAGERK